MVSTIQVSLDRHDWHAVFQPLPFLDRITMGGRQSGIPVPGCPEGAVLLCEKRKDGFLFRAQGCRIPEAGDGTVAVDHAAAQSFHVCAMDGTHLFGVHAALTAMPEAPEYDRMVEISGDRTIRIGANPEADIVLQHPLLTGPVCELTHTGSGWIVRSAGPVPMGLYADTERVDGQVRVPDGSFLSAPGMRFYLGADCLRMPSRDNVRVATLPYLDGSEQNSHLRYPCISRTSRRILTLPKEPITVQDPPAASEPPKRNLLISLLPAAMMILLTVFLRGSFSGGSMILFSAASLSIGAFTSVLTYFQTGKEAKKKAAGRKAAYERYIDACDKRIAESRAEEVRILSAIHISPQQELRNVRDFSAELFDRQPSDDDFLDILLGYGTLRSRRPVVCKSHEVFESVDELYRLPQKLRQKYALQEGLPSCVRARQANAVGIVGDLRPLRGLLRNISLDLVTRHYFEDIGLYYFLSDAFLPEKTALRMMPHVKDRATGRRNIACDEESRALMLETLFKELCRRETEKDAAAGAPWLVIFVHTDDSPIVRHPIMGFVEKAAALHAVFLFLSAHRDLLPQGCTALVQLASNTDMGVLRMLTTDQPDQLFGYEAVSDAVLGEVGQRLAPVYSSEISLASHLNGSESLFGMLGIRSEDELDVAAEWKHADTARHIAAPMGILDNGKVLELDLHETVHGPHGLVAGTTGSGKSQVLISYILSLATRYSPEDLTFAVIDFKGGDIVKQLPNLPHIVGSITNLSKDEINRSLRSINAEKNKRMTFFDEEHANVSNITEYTKAYRAGKVKTPLPHLVIIVDEFAELRSQFPESMQELISIARVGRSLGIHIILCTQKPAGVVDGQIRSNSDFQICLRVQTREDSNEVLSSPLAAEIHEPGRGYLQVGRTEQFELFQSGYSGAPSRQSEQSTAFTISGVDLSGRRSPLYEFRPTAQDSGRTQREAVLGRVIEAFEQSGMRKPAPLCMPSLEEILPYEDQEDVPTDQIPIGLYDDPDTQSICRMSVDVDAKNTLIVGNSQMGKTNLLMTMLRYLAMHMTADQTAVYAMDYSAKAIKALEGLDIVGGVVIEGEDDKLKSLLKTLRQEVEKRKAAIMEAHVTTFRAYQALRSDLPLILVLIDNYAIFNERYEETLGDSLTFLLREGPSLGICFVVTVQNISLINYRKAYLFPQHIALPLNDRSQYSSVLEGCRRDLKEIPGRTLILLNKKIFEGQVYEAFGGKTEEQRVKAIQAFVAEHSGRGPAARGIPVIPETLTTRYIEETFPRTARPDEMAVAMDYSDIVPVYMNLQRAFSLSLLGGDETARHRFAALMIRKTLEQPDTEVWLFDRYDRPLKSALPAVPNLHYTTDNAGMASLFDQLKPALEAQLESARKSEDGMPEGKLYLVVFNSEESMRYLSAQSTLMSAFHSIADSYRRMKVFFLFPDVPNRPIRYNAPELLRFIGEEKQALLFGELNSIKAFDIPHAIVRAMSGTAGLDDAFLMQEEEINRVKLIRETV
ncbi:MAG: type VII secretion protein EssC [Clostridia bacterium]|nr:type VII secretion protein EssC [Clostridia bacterium]